MTPSKSYEQMYRSELEGRSLEASVLSRAARKLSRCAETWEQRGSNQFNEQLGEALSFTQRLWTFLQVEIANPDHPMPQSLRKSIFQLSRYVDQTVMRLYSGGTLQDLNSLIALNKELAGGLLADLPPQVSTSNEGTKVPGATSISV